MSKLSKPELSKNNPYWIDKHRYYELKHFCLQYPTWKKAYVSLDGMSKKPEQLLIFVQTGACGDPTAKCALAKTYYYERIAMLEHTAIETDKELGSYILIDEEWNDVSHYAEDKPGTKYQCKRMSSLFKDVFEDGTVKYTDVNRCYCKDIHTGSTYNFGIVGRLIDEMYPITMPYIPEDKSYVVFCEDFLFEGKGDFDTFGILYLRDPKGNTVQINRFFKEGEEDSLIEISKEEYESRRPKKEE